MPIGGLPISLLEIKILALKLFLFHRFSLLKWLLLATVKLRVDNHTIIQLIQNLGIKTGVLDL